MKNLRLDKYLADMAIGTRSEIKEIIKKGQVSVNGESVKRPEFKVDPEMDIVTLNGKKIAYAKFSYYMLNKPAGYVSATEDEIHKTVLDILEVPQKKDFFPVGRLDIDTEGLLLITNDGALAHKLLSPKKHVKKTYFAKIRGRVDDTDVTRMKAGLDIGEKKPTLPAELVILTSDEISEICLTITEGKFHQVKRMFEAVGKEVLYLKRLSMGTLSLDDTLKPGQYRPLSEKEISDLKGNSDVRA